ncbi:MAG: hypothetical protein IJ334_04100, partial [Clostridia bacterium]|nr:hypothetical protein [Clostridia bacterium]
MQYIIREDSIDILPLSKRAANCAHRIGVQTIGEFLDITEEEWINTRNLGQKTLDEILELAKSIIESTGEFRLAENCSEAELSELEEIRSAPKYDDDAIYIDANNHIVHDAAIEDIAPSVRACNALKHAGYDYASQVMGLTEEEIANIHNVGVKTVNEIKDMISNLKIIYVSDATSESEGNDSKASSQKHLAEELLDSFGQTRGFWIRETVAVRSEYTDIQGETLIYRLYERVTVRDAVRTAIVSWLDVQDVMSHTALEKMMPNHCSNTTILDELLLELERQGKVTIADSNILRVYPSIMDFVSLIEDERHRMIFADRFTGKTLDEIGTEYDITRERVRQIIQKEFRFIHKCCDTPKFREDQYLPMFRKYQFFEKDFSDAYDEPISTYCYLDIIDDIKLDEKCPLEEILTDDSISPEFRRRAEKIIYKDYITDNGVRVKANRQHLVKHFVRQYCKELTDYDAFYDAYHHWLEQFKIKDIDKCVLNAKSSINFLSGADFVLWNWSGKFRYYYIPERDYGELLDALGLDQYTDAVISAAKWFQDYPEIMAQYDIRDGFELHNLLKKIEIPESYHIQFGKMPTIILGQGSVENQLFELIVEYAPISGDDLALKYEELYGV